MPSALFRLFVIVMATLTLTACVSSPKRPSKPDEPQPIIKSAIGGMISVPKDRRQAGILLNIVDNPGLVTAMAEKITAYGYRVATDPSAAAYRLNVAPIYIGDDGHRPPVGSSERAVESPEFGHLLPHLANSIAFFLRPGGYRAVLIDVAGRAVGADQAFDMAVKGVRLQLPVDALVMQATLIGPEGTQVAQILTQSYLPHVPLNSLVEDNMKTLLYLLE